nr:MAG TPA: hypothetical protein [Caudoviricetes sp.]
MCIFFMYLCIVVYKLYIFGLVKEGGGGKTA